MAVSPLAERIIDEQARGKWRIRQQGNEMGRWFLRRRAEGWMSHAFGKHVVNATSDHRHSGEVWQQRKRLESVAGREADPARLLILKKSWSDSRG